MNTYIDWLNNNQILICIISALILLITGIILTYKTDGRLEHIMLFVFNPISIATCIFIVATAPVSGSVLIVYGGIYLLLRKVRKHQERKIYE